MTVSKRTFLIWWIGGLVAFGVVIYLHLPLAVEGVPGGISDHQSAPDAATVNAIHAAWKEAGVFDAARTAMIGDLIFIGIYGIGCVLGGIYLRSLASPFVRALGLVALVGGLTFLLTDYGETIAQFIQLSRDAGDDGLAAFASAIRPIKMASFVAAFLSIVVALVVGRLSAPRA